MRVVNCVMCSGKGYEVFGTGTETGDVRRFCNVCNGSGIVYADFLYVRQAGYHPPVDHAHVPEGKEKGLGK